MGYLLKLEWLKFRRNTVFLLMSSLYLFLLPALFLLSRSIFSTAPGMSSEAMMSFPAVWSVVGYIGNWLAFFFLGFFAIYMFTSEFTNRTYRQNVINGISRRQLYFAKVLFLIVIAILAAVFYACVCLLIGLAATKNISMLIVFERASLIPRYFIMCLGYMSLGLLFSILIRRTAVTVFLYFVYILFFEVIVRWSFHRKIADNITMNLYPANAFEDLVPMPLADWALTQQFVSDNQGISFLSPAQAVLTSLVYLVIILGWGYFNMSRRDL